MNKRSYMKNRSVILLTMVSLFLFIFIGCWGEESSEQTENAENTETQQRTTYIQETDESILYRVEDGVAVYSGDIIIGDPDVIDEEGVPLSALYPEETCQGDEDQEGGCIDSPVRETFIQGTDEVIQYQIIDGLAIYGGDIVIGRPDVIDVEGVPLSAISSFTSSDPNSVDENDEAISKKAFYHQGVKWRWEAGRYPVYYMFSKALNHTDRATIIGAMRVITNVNPYIRFLSTSTYQPGSIEEPRMPAAWIYIHASNTTSYSPIGRRSGRQVLGLNPGGRKSQRVIVHELMHALGFSHEHQRPDRDKYVVVDFGNIISSKQHNFTKRPYLRHSTVYGPYDYYSIMHYTSYSSFAVDKSKPVILRLPHYTTYMGGRHLSNNDKNALRHMYQRPPRKPQHEEPDYNG